SRKTSARARRCSTAMASSRVLEGDVVAESLDASNDQLLETRRFAEGWRLWAIRLGLLGLILGAWEGLAGNPKTEWALVDKFWMSQPSDIYVRLSEWISRGTLWLHLLITLQEMVIGLVIGSAVGIALGF